MEQQPIEQKKKSIWKIFGCGCLVILLAIFAFAVYFGISARKPKKVSSDQATPAARSTPVALKFPRAYLGKWQSGDGTIVWIKSDGKADFHTGDTDVLGGALILDEKKKVLKISSDFDISKQWKIERAPKTQTGQTTIKLSGHEFRRVASGDAP